MKVMTVTYTALAHIPVPDDGDEAAIQQRLERGEIELLKAESQDFVSVDDVEFNDTPFDTP